MPKLTIEVDVGQETMDPYIGTWAPETCSYENNAEISKSHF